MKKIIIGIGLALAAVGIAIAVSRLNESGEKEEQNL
jgi:hypothetical protein